MGGSDAQGSGGRGEAGTFKVDWRPRGSGRDVVGAVPGSSGIDVLKPEGRCGAGWSLNWISPSGVGVSEG